MIHLPDPPEVRNQETALVQAIRALLAVLDREDAGKQERIERAEAKAHARQAVADWEASKR